MFRPRGVRFHASPQFITDGFPIAGFTPNQPRAEKDGADMKREKSSLFHMLFPWLLIVFIFLACFFLFNIFKKAAEHLESKRGDDERMIARRVEVERERLKTRLELEKEQELTGLKLGYEETIKRLVAEKHALKERMERENAEKITALKQEDIANSISRKQEMDALILRLTEENEELKERLASRNAAQPGPPSQEAAVDSSSKKKEMEATILQLRQENETLKKRMESLAAQRHEPAGKVDDPGDSAVVDRFNRDRARIIANIDQLIQKKLFHQAGEEIARWDLPPLADEMHPVKGALREAELFEHARKVPARNIYLNILLYEHLSRLNPEKELYTNKLNLYRDRYRKVHGKDKETSECYDRGYLQGRCMILSTLGAPCGLDDEARIPKKCRRGRDAFQGMKKGVASMGK